MAAANGAGMWGEFLAGVDGDGRDGHGAHARLAAHMRPLLREVLRAWGNEHDETAVDATWNELLVQLLVRGGKALVDTALLSGASFDDALRPFARRAVSRAGKLQQKGRPPRKRAKKARDGSNAPADTSAAAPDDRAAAGQPIPPPTKPVPIEARPDPRASDPALAAELRNLKAALWRLTWRDSDAGTAVAQAYLAQVLELEPLNFAEIRRAAAEDLRLAEIRGGAAEDIECRPMDPKTIVKYVDEYRAEVLAKLGIALRRE